MARMHQHTRPCNEQLATCAGEHSRVGGLCKGHQRGSSRDIQVPDPCPTACPTVCPIALHCYSDPLLCPAVPALLSLLPCYTTRVVMFHHHISPSALPSITHNCPVSPVHTVLLCAMPFIALSPVLSMPLPLLAPRLSCPRSLVPAACELSLAQATHPTRPS